MGTGGVGGAAGAGGGATGGAAPCDGWVRSGIFFLGDFETGDLTGFNPSGNSPTVASDPTRAGSYAMRTSLDRFNDPVAFRTEVVPQDQTFEVGDEVWYGFSIYLPDEYVADSIWEITAQWHGRPDFDLGEDWRNPPLALHSAHGQWRISNLWDSKANTFESGEREYDGGESFELGAYETGRWTDWVFHLVWSYESDGLLQVWQDGQLVVDRPGPNTFNDAEGPYMKMGLYKGWKDPDTVGDVDTRLLFHDELRIGDDSASYCDVAPGD